MMSWRLNSVTVRGAQWSLKRASLSCRSIGVSGEEDGIPPFITLATRLSSANCATGSQAHQRRSGAETARRQYGGSAAAARRQRGGSARRSRAQAPKHHRHIAEAAQALRPVSTEATRAQRRDNGNHIQLGRNT
jgi:hypothetical protein